MKVCESLFVKGILIVKLVYNEDIQKKLITNHKNISHVYRMGEFGMLPNIYGCNIHMQYLWLSQHRYPTQKTQHDPTSIACIHYG